MEENLKKSQPAEKGDYKRRRNIKQYILIKIVSSILYGGGIDGAKISVLQALAEILQSCLSRVGRLGSALAAAAGRAQPVASDAVLALKLLGLRTAGPLGLGGRRLPQLQRPLMPPPPPGCFWAPPPRLMMPPPSPAGKQRGPPRPPRPWAGGSSPVPPPDPGPGPGSSSRKLHRHLPPLPRAHTYIRTPCFAPLQTEALPLRLRKIQHRRDAEQALIQFRVRCDRRAVCPLPDEPRGPYTLLSGRPRLPLWLSALVPRDQFLPAYRSALFAAHRRWWRLARSAPDNPFLKAARLPPGAEGEETATGSETDTEWTEADEEDADDQWDSGAWEGVAEDEFGEQWLGYGPALDGDLLAD